MKHHELRNYIDDVKATIVDNMTLNIILNIKIDPKYSKEEITTHNKRYQPLKNLVIEKVRCQMMSSPLKELNPRVQLLPFYCPKIQ